MHILVTNDDGVQAPGLLALAQELRKLGKVTVFAPDRNWSASGHVKTLDRPLRVREVRLADDTPAYSCDGAPSDCVALPLMGFVEEKIDVVVSGINPNANIGHDVTYSGTVTAAMEAVITGCIPGIAISLDAPENHSGLLDYSTAARVARKVTEKVMADRPAGRGAVERQRAVPDRGAIQRHHGDTPGTARLPGQTGAPPRPARTPVLLDRRRSSHRRPRGGDGFRRAESRVRLHHARCNWT